MWSFEFRVSGFELAAHGSRLGPASRADLTQDRIHWDSRSLVPGRRARSGSSSPTEPETRNPKPGTPTRAKAGFTLVELLIAIALSAILLLVAFIAFRSVTRTMADLEALAAENRLLRSGYLLAMKDADFWHSHADPTYPYLRRHNAATADDNSVYDVRPFRRVRWEQSLTDPENPNWAQPHDPRSWYRNHLMPNTMTGTFFWTNEGKYRFEPDFGHAIPDDERKQLGWTGYNAESRASRIACPPGWESWHVTGDYAAIANIDRDDVAGHRPRQQWEVAKRLGTRGLVTYLPPGTPNLIQASSVNERQLNYVDLDTRVDTHFRKGEIPWSLNFTNNLVTVRQMDVRAGDIRPPEDYTSYPPSFAVEYPEYNRGNYAIMMPSRFDAARNDGISFQPLPFLSDFQVPSGDCYPRPVQNLNGGLNGGAISPMGMVYPANPILKTFGSDDYEWYEYLFDVYKPLTVLDLPMTREGNSFGKSSSSELGASRELDPDVHYRDLRQRHSHLTWYLPVNHTDSLSPMLDGNEVHRANMGVRVYRYLHSGNDHVECEVIIRDESTDRETVLRLKPLTTSYRGARQYWGRRSGAQGMDDGFGHLITLGDWYE